MDAIFSIKPQYAEQILNGTKKFEYRKQNLKQQVNKIIIYSTAPVKRAVGEFTVKQIHSGNPLEVWESTYERGGILAVDFMNYYKNSEIAYAIEVDQFYKYKQPKLYKEIDSSGKIPQSFKYLWES